MVEISPGPVETEFALARRSTGAGTGVEGQWQYRKARLRVSETVSGGHKRIIDFTPAQYAVPEIAQIKLKLDADGEIRAQDHNIIYHGSVIEFVYDPQQPFGYQWIPIRFRADKTSLKAPNARRTAESTWALIRNPVTLAMITGVDVTVTRDTVAPQYYSQNDAALTKLVKPLRIYHNQIKSQIITAVADQLRKR